MRTDAELVGLLYNKLRAEGLRVWLDSECLVDGVKWEDGFADGLFQSAIFVSVLSKGALAPYASLLATSECDNLLLEQRLATTLLQRGHLRHVVPVLVGEAVAELGNGLGAGFGSFWHRGGGVPTCEAHSVGAVEERAAEHLRRNGFAEPPARTPAQTYAVPLSPASLPLRNSRCRGGPSSHCHPTTVAPESP